MDREQGGSVGNLRIAFRKGGGERAFKGRKKIRGKDFVFQSGRRTGRQGMRNILERVREGLFKESYERAMKGGGDPIQGRKKRKSGIGRRGGK